MADLDNLVPENGSPVPEDGPPEGQNPAPPGSGPAEEAANTPENDAGPAPETAEERLNAIGEEESAALSETITESLFEAEAAPVVQEEDKQPDAPGKPAPAGKEGEGSGVNGVMVGMSLCDAVIQSVGTDRFHGGVRPDNISVRDGQVFLGSTLKHGVGEFTPQELEYMAPELFWDGIRTPASDVYSIGLVLYSLYNYGRLPFWPAAGAITPNARASALQKRMSDEALTPPANADAELAAVILRALAFRTEERWQDAEELRNALGTCDASDSSVDISLTMTGLLARNTDQKSADAGSSGAKTHTYYDDVELNTGRKPIRRRNLSWLWILLALLLIAGAVLLLVNDNFKLGGGTPEPTATAEPTEAPTPTPTAEPTPEVTATPEPTKRPSGPKYVVYRENVSWSEAVKRCEELGGWLAIPANEEELASISRLCNNEMLTFAWLGASRQPDGSWLTPAGEEITFFRWSEGEPSFIDAGDNVAENYLLLWKRGENDWLYNDSRENPLKDYGFLYRGNIGFVCQMW